MHPENRKRSLQRKTSSCLLLSAIFFNTSRAAGFSLILGSAVSLLRYFYGQRMPTILSQPPLQGGQSTVIQGCIAGVPASGLPVTAHRSKPWNLGAQWLKNPPGSYTHLEEMNSQTPSSASWVTPKLQGEEKSQSSGASEAGPGNHRRWADGKAAGWGKWGPP